MAPPARKTKNPPLRLAHAGAAEKMDEIERQVLEDRRNIAMFFNGSLTAAYREMGVDETADRQAIHEAFDIRRTALDREGASAVRIARLSTAYHFVLDAEMHRD